MLFRVEAFFMHNKILNFNILENSHKILPKSQLQPLTTELLIKKKRVRDITVVINAKKTKTGLGYHLI